jgi:hypothetical protein
MYSPNTKSHVVIGARRRAKVAALRGANQSHERRRRRSRLIDLCFVACGVCLFAIVGFVDHKLCNRTHEHENETKKTYVVTNKRNSRLPFL